MHVKWKNGMKIGVFRPIFLLYFEHGTRYDHSYDERRIGTRMRLKNGAISDDPDFKVTPIFNVKYGISGT